VDGLTKMGVAIIVGFILIVCVVGAIAFFVGRSYSSNSAGATGDTATERALLARIGEYQQREEDRNRREAERIRAERARIERTENAINAIRGLDRRSGDLYTELEQEATILADYFRYSAYLNGNQLVNIGDAK